MDAKPPFDTTKAAFYLVAGVIAVQCVIVLAGAMWCAWLGGDAPNLPSRCENLRGMLSELLTGALAAALAFAGGYTRKDK